MKKSIFICLLLVFATTVSAQSFNQESSRNDHTYLIGKFNKEKLETEPYASWFQSNYDSYVPESAVLAELKEQLSDYTITLFMGTWCGDSKREVPRFYNLLEAADFPMERLTAVALHPGKDKMKQSPGGEEEGLGIHRVPTIIVYKEGQEVGRIVEEPVESFEKDLLNLLEGSYRENYYGVSLAQQALNNMGWEKFGKSRKKLARKLAPYLERYMELHTFSRVLNAAGKTKESYEILQLNQLLFPEEPNVYFNLGVYLWNNYQEEEAEIQFAKALELEDRLNHQAEDLSKKIAFIKENRKPQF